MFLIIEIFNTSYFRHQFAKLRTGIYVKVLIIKLKYLIKN